MSDRRQVEHDLRAHPVGLLHKPLVAKAILALAVALTASGWIFTRAVVKRVEDDRFRFETEEVEQAIRERMSIYERVLWGGVGLFESSDSVSRQEWARYVARVDLNRHWPGIQGMGFAVPLEPDEVDAHVAEVRAEGFADFTVKPAGERDQYSSIVYLEPFDWRNQRAFGFDMWSNEMRREAMARARDTGAAATSGAITLVQETDEDVQVGFLTYVPVYEAGARTDTVAQRRAAFVGWVYAPFRTSDLMRGAIGEDLAISYQIFDGTEPAADNLLHDSDPSNSGTDAEYWDRSTFEIQGRDWTIVFRSADGFGEGGGVGLPTVIMVAGIVIDLLLFWVISSLGLLNTRASSLARKMTAELRTATEGLERRSDELERQTLKLQRSNSELEQFAYVASHDLQEPLRNMGSYSKLLTDRYGEQLGEEGGRWLSYIATGAEQMSNLIREILVLSSTGGNAEPFTVVDLGEVTAAAVANLGRIIEETGAELSVDELPSVFGDRGELVRLLQNLIANAVKYRDPDAPPRISITAVKLEDGEVEESKMEDGEVGDGEGGGAMWRISVGDNGIGIKPEYQERVFEIFRRVGSRADYPGTGIGLSICRKIVEGHGGEIGVHSALGEGSEFWFTVPARRVEPTESSGHGQPMTVGV